jgi:excisionase family DNA binding protein
MSETETPYTETPYVHIHTVADYFQVSVSTVRKWVQSGKIPRGTYINVGEVYRFRLKDIDTALTAAPTKNEDEDLEP